VWAQGVRYERVGYRFWTLNRSGSDSSVSLKKQISRGRRPEKNQTETKTKGGTPKGGSYPEHCSSNRRSEYGRLPCPTRERRSSLSAADERSHQSPNTKEGFIREGSRPKMRKEKKRKGKGGCKRKTCSATKQSLTRGESRSLQSGE